ncbi:MAG: hypothetical protein AMXMBFR84_49400 [Candidatus Hydrogenedentota bacterium]
MKIICIGAHPDDAEFYTGGTALKWVDEGHSVLLVSMTNGDIGHFRESGGALAQRRSREAHLSAERGGMQGITLGYHDGELQPTIEARKEVVRLIRRWEADIVITHRPNDYHPDHRYTSILVQDAAFMVTVPYFCPEAPRMERNPIFLYMMDGFQRPVPFRPDIAVDISGVIDRKVDMLDAMDSQMYEWLPWLHGTIDQVPAPGPGRKVWLRSTLEPILVKHTELAKPGLDKWYGKRKSKSVRQAEAFEICEYGHQPNDEEIRRLFPF